MNTIKEKTASLRPSVEDLFNKVDDLSEKGKLSEDDQEWLGKELVEMKKKLRA
jgi:hypothetical protein